MDQLLPNEARGNQPTPDFANCLRETHEEPHVCTQGSFRERGDVRVGTTEHPITKSTQTITPHKAGEKWHTCERL